MNALITGGSNGIGLELAQLFAKDKTNVILVARDQKDLDTAAGELARTYGIKTETIAIDLSLPDAADAVYKKVRELGWPIDYLVNDAGFGNFGPFAETDWATEHSMIELNITALSRLSKLFIPDMVARNRGKILNLASTAAFIPGPFMSIYYASKAYVLSFSQAINSELRGTNVSVTALCPGPTKTNFEKAAHADSSRLFKGRLLSPEYVARYGYSALMKGKSVAIPGFGNKVLIFFSRFLSRDVITAISKKAATG
jgi:short-subunit dehydrogenase